MATYYPASSSWLLLIGYLVAMLERQINQTHARARARAHTHTHTHAHTHTRQRTHSVATYYPASSSWLLLIGYPVAMLGGQINSFGIFAFLWLLPNDQNLISSMVGGAQVSAPLLPIKNISP